WKKLLPMPLDLPIVMTPELYRQTFFQSASDDLILDDKIYGMPLSIDNLAVFYNKQVFRDLLATTDHPGLLWEEIKDQVFQLTKRDNSPERFGLSGIALGRSDNISSAVDILYALMIEFGTQFYDDKEERATFADTQTGAVSKPGVAALELFTSFALPSYKHYSWNETMTGRDPESKDIGAFVRGKVAMVIGYPYLYSVIDQLIQSQQKLGLDHMDLKNVGIAPLPQLVSPDQSSHRDTLASYFPLVVARTSDLSKESWSFVQFITSADPAQTYYKKTHRPTARKDLVTEQQTDATFGAFAFQAPFAKTFRIYDAEAYAEVFEDAIQSVVKNLATPEQAMTEAQQKITCVIRKQKKLLSGDEDCGI
ncbi:MAG: extracellular solute-binding protein, partial [Candidatus Peregrinibacteria bacterium]